MNTNDKEIEMACKLCNELIRTIAHIECAERELSELSQNLSVEVDSLREMYKSIGNECPDAFCRDDVVNVGKMLNRVMFEVAQYKQNIGEELDTLTYIYKNMLDATE